MTTASLLAKLRYCTAAAVLALTLLAVPQDGYGHGIIGKRMFVEPLFGEDANIKNELVFPRTEFLRMPDGTVRTLGFSLEKQLWPDRWSVSIEQGLASVRTSGCTISGFDNLEVSTKTAVYTNEPHEFILSPTLGFSLPTGSRKLVERKTAISGGLLLYVTSRQRWTETLNSTWRAQSACRGRVKYRRCGRSNDIEVIIVKEAHLRPPVGPKRSS